MLAWSWLMHGPTIVLRHVEVLSCCNALISYLIIWITFKYISCRLVGISHWLLCNILDKIWSFELIIFKAIHICICHMSIIGNGNTHKVLIGCLLCPIDSNAPGIQLAMWLGQMKIFRTMLCTMCQNYWWSLFLHRKLEFQELLGLLYLFLLFILLGNCFFSSLENTTTSHELATSAREFKISPWNDVARCRNKYHHYYIQYATMWLPLHTEVQYLHSGYHY